LPVKAPAPDGLERGFRLDCLRLIPTMDPRLFQSLFCWEKGFRDRSTRCGPPQADWVSILVLPVKARHLTGWEGIQTKPGQVDMGAGARVSNLVLLEKGFRHGYRLLREF
jgi:hypothetical protein